MNTQTQRFQPDELVTWTSRVGETWTRRPVAFRSYAPGGRAVVEFGHSAESVARRYDVPLSELSRAEAPSNIPIYHSAPIKPPSPPKPLSEAQLTARELQARSELAAAHDTARLAREATASTGELVRRAQAEHRAATAALSTLDKHDKADALKLERALRAGETPPVSQPNGQDRGYLVQRVDACAAALAKFQAEDREAQARLSAATAAIRAAATSVITAMLEKDIAELRQLEEMALQYRADLIRVTQQMGASGTPLRLSEAANTVLSVPIDADRVRFMGSAAVPPWEALLRRLLAGESDAEFAAQPVAGTQSEAA